MTQGGARGNNTGAVVVGIPIRDEAERIGQCLRDLAAQSRRPDWVVCLLNNCTDRSADVVAHTPVGRVRIAAIGRTLPGGRATAGQARRLALAHAARLAGPAGVLLTTDADARLPPDWIARNLAALRAGADAVCGQADIDPLEARAIPPHLHADDALECRYGRLLDHIAALLDPDPADPWPRHTQEPGASIAVRVAAFRMAGGIPPARIGEDRAFIQALREQDAAIRHDPDIRVVVSGRTIGRASGGMADTMRRRIVRQDEYVDAALEPAPDAFRRADFRARLRQARQAGAAPAELVQDLHMSATAIADALALPRFGAAWARIQAACPVMHRRRVAFADLPRQIAEAEALLSLARARGAARGDRVSELA